MTARRFGSLRKIPQLRRILVAYPWSMAGLGALTGLGQPPFNLPLLSLLGLFGLVFAFHAQALAQGNWRRSFALCWWFGTGYFALVLHWIVEPFFVDPVRHGWMAPFALILMVGGLSLFWGVAGAMAHLLRSNGKSLSRVTVIAALLSAELLRGWIFTGFPWAPLYGVLLETPLAIAISAGPFWGSLAALYLLWLARFGLRLLGFTPRSRWRSVSFAKSMLVFCLALAVPVGLGYVQARDIRAYDAKLAASEQAGDAMRLRIIQPNEAQDLKWESGYITEFWQRKLALTAAGSDPRPDVILWPEVSLPYLLGSNPDADLMIAEAAQGATVLAGAQRFEGAELRNSLALIPADGWTEAVYDKHHLVPFGEYMPGAALLDRFGIFGLATDSLGAFSPGAGAERLDLGELGRVAPLICYEAIFWQYANYRDWKDGDWILQVTNDAWFGTFAGPQQHLQLARMRAMEQGVPLLRSANTGISAVIDGMGRVVAQIPMGQEGFIDLALPPVTKDAGLYPIRAGLVDIFVFSPIGLLLFEIANKCIAWRRRRRGK
ncbi:MAG: apolipoprotein N-acyltransferase [Mangrovicoccus sp.]